MKNHGKLILILFISVSIFACNQNHSDQNHNEKKENLAQAESFNAVDKNILSSSAATDNGNDRDRKFLRTAEIKIKVDDVEDATYAVEDIINNSGGFVSYTNLKSDIVNTKSVRVCKDSSLETTSYNVQNLMTIRVPNTKLDTALKSISKLVKYLDYRVIKADDVSLQILSNELEQKRNSRTEELLTKAIETKSRKSTATNNLEDEISDGESKTDAAKISNLALLDQVKYSTINLSLYQDKVVESKMVLIDKKLIPYEAPFSERVTTSLNSGWNILEQIIIFVSGLWSFLLIGLLIFLFIRTLKRRALI